jgi:hypothetical protein
MVGIVYWSVGLGDRFHIKKGFKKLFNASFEKFIRLSGCKGGKFVIQGGWEDTERERGGQHFELHRPKN